MMWVSPSGKYSNPKSFVNFLLPPLTKGRAGVGLKIYDSFRIAIDVELLIEEIYAGKCRSAIRALYYIAQTSNLHPSQIRSGLNSKLQKK